MRRLAFLLLFFPSELAECERRGHAEISCTVDLGGAAFRCSAQRQRGIFGASICFRARAQCDSGLEPEARVCTPIQPDELVRMVVPAPALSRCREVRSLVLDELDDHVL